MNNKFDKLTKGSAQSVSRRAVLQKFGVGLAGKALAFILASLLAVAGPNSPISAVSDPAGDAVFPYDLYDGPVPPYLDTVEASVAFAKGVFRFEIKMNTDIPADANPGLSPNVNHLGATVGILTDRKTAGSPNKFFGQTDVYHFNYLVGAVYSVEDSGVGLDLGWRGFLISDAGVFEIPLKIRKDTLILEVSAATLGDPATFDWAVGVECDPVSIPDEKMKTVVLVDYIPDHGYATWPAP